jgi:hypothetical protein
MTDEELSDVFAEMLPEPPPEGINCEISPEGEISMELLSYIFDID